MRNKIKNNSFAKGPKNLFIIVFFFIAGIALLTKLTEVSRQVKIMSYSSFMNAVKQDKVDSVHIAGQEVYGLLKDGNRFEAIIADNPKVLEVLEEHNVELSINAPASQYSLWYMVLLSMLLLLPLALWYFFRQMRGSGSGANNIFSMGKSRARMFMPSMIKTNFDKVAGLEQAKDALRDIVDFLKNPEKYRRLGAKIPRGVLLVGEPGNGKTLLAKAVAGQANCPFFSITGSDFIEVFVGVGAARVRDLFAQARKHAPSIVFIDEIDAIGRSRGSGFGGGHDEREQTLNQLLTEMDGFETSNSNVIVIAATNIPDVLDKALLRPGRFDRWVNVEYPDEKARKQILEIHARKVRMASDINLDIIANETAGFSGADLENLVNEAAIRSSKKNQENVTMQDLLDAHKLILQTRQGNTGGSAGSVLSKGNSKPKMFMPTQVKTKFADVAGIPEAKAELLEVVDFLKNPEKYRRLGAKLPKGVLLIGSPGNGKTLLAKAVAGEANCPFFSVSASDFVEMYVGVGASRVRDLFGQARRHSPAIIFIDEIDAVGGKRVAGHDGGNEERAQTLNQLLTEMDGFNSDDSAIIVMAATNRADVLDSALLRPGRFDRHIEVSYPNIKSREQILKVHTKNLPLDPSVDLARIARSTSGFSGADLAHMANEAALHATKNNQNTITMHDFEHARDRISLGAKKPSIVMSDNEKEMTAFHEAGHALVRLLCPNHTDPLDKVTILPQGPALGVTFFMPERDKYTQTKTEMINSIMALLGGGIAERIAFNERTTGTSSDYQHATDLARRIACFGLTDELGTVYYSQGYGHYKYSEKTAEKIDAAVHEILEKARIDAEELLRDNRDKLDTLAKALLEKETLYAEEIYPLLGIEPREGFKLTTDEAPVDA
jgi:cell division protease FtsH